MTVLKRALIAFLVLCGVAAAGSVAQAGPPFPLRETLKFDSQSRYAMIVYEAEPQILVPHWTLEMLAFSPAERRWTYNPLNGWTHFGRLPVSTTRQYAVSLVKPAGVYAFNHLGTQGYWRACLNGGTKAFDIQVGKINFLGRVDPTPTLAQIITDMPPVMQTSKPVYIFGTPRLSWTPPSAIEGWEINVATWLKQRFPRVSGDLVGVEPQDVTFPIGTTLNGYDCEKY